jgi:hypothetical protein
MDAACSYAHQHYTESPCPSHRSRTLLKLQAGAAATVLVAG